MDLFLKITLVIIVIILATIILFPCREYFQNAVDTLKSKSSVLYSKKDLNTEDDYINSLNPISNDLLIMYRCIEFKQGGIENVIATLKQKNKFFISNKYEANYTDFSTIEEEIKKSILKLHDDSKKKMYGPIYLLITQYPLYNTISKECVITTQSSPLENSFSPIVQNVDVECGDLAHPEKLVKCEFYILMPSHLPNNGLVGEHNDVPWETIAENMSDLLVGNSNINNVRSQDKQCFTKCGEIQVDGYVCGARNSIGDKPYKSVVFNSPANNTTQKALSDYANLYILNTNGINNLLGMTIETTRIIEEGVKTQAATMITPEEQSAAVSPTSTTDDNANMITHIDRDEYDRVQKALQEELDRLERKQQLEFMSDEQAKCYLARYIDLRNAFGSDIERAKKHWIDHGISEKRIKECDDEMMVIINGLTNGLTKERAAPSAKHILETYGTTNNGIYWIDLPVVGPTQVYCIMNPECAGGGWMLAMKGKKGTTFHYESKHWKNATTLNKENPSQSEDDAKYDVFNYYKARDWFAGFPDVPEHAGDLSRKTYNGFTWVENNAVNSRRTLLDVFSRNQQITKSQNPTNLQKFHHRVWSRQDGFKFYGINYQGGRGFKTRWGFGWNNERHEGSNDAGGGIGTQNVSAGDHFKCCGSRGLDRRMRFEFYVR